MTVVVEATLKGGARLTPDHAVDYGARHGVSGVSPHPASAGTNQLIYDGRHRRARSQRRTARVGFSGPGPRADQRALPLGDQAAVLEACHGEPATLDHCQRAATHPSSVVAAVRALERRLDGAARGLCWPQ